LNHAHLLTGFFTGVFAGFFDTIAGGGGLITLPVLMGFNLPPVTALGTNRLQGCIGELTASIEFFKSGELPLKEIILGLFFAVIGATLGSLFDLGVPKQFLNHLIPIVLIILIIFLLTNKQHKESDKPRMKKTLFFIIFGLLIGFYNGFCGPSTGFFWITTLIIFLGIDLRHAIMRSKPLNFIGNLASLSVFISAGTIAWSIGFAMAAGQIIGAYAGAQFVLVKNIKVIKPIFLTIAIILAAHMLYKQL
jgi:uncharacterized membrane protein YfcA